MKTKIIQLAFIENTFFIVAGVSWTTGNIQKSGKCRSWPPSIRCVVRRHRGSCFLLKSFIYVNFESAYSVFVTEKKSIFSGLLWCFADEWQAAEFGVNPASVIPAKVEQGEVCLLVSTSFFFLFRINLVPQFGCFSLWSCCSQSPWSSGLKCSLAGVRTSLSSPENTQVAGKLLSSISSSAVDHELVQCYRINSVC